MEPTLDELRARLAGDPTDPLAYAALAHAYRATNAMRPLAELVERWAERCTDAREAARAWAEAGEHREQLGDTERACRHYARALELDTRQAIAASGFVRLSTDLRDVHRQIEVLESWARRLTDEHASPNERADAEIALARAWASITGRLDRSLEHYKSAITLDPELESMLDEALDRARKARRGNDVRTLLALGAESTRVPVRRVALLRALAEARKELPVDLDGAVDALAAASRDAPDDLALREELIALIAMRAQRRKGTEGAATDAARMADLWVELARLQPDEPACASLEHALDLVPTHPAALTLFEELATRRRTPDRLIVRLEALVAREVGDARNVYVHRKLAALHAEAGHPEAAYLAVAPLLEGAVPPEFASLALEFALAAGRLGDAARILPRLFSGWSEERARKALLDLLARARDADDVGTLAEAARQLLAIAPNDDDALVAMAEAHTRRGEASGTHLVLERRIGLAADPTKRKELLRELVALADGPLADDVTATDAFQRLAELDPRDAAIRAELLTRLRRHGRLRAIANVHAWEVANLETQTERRKALVALLALHDATPVESSIVVAALRVYRATEPGDANARHALVEFLRAAGELVEASELLRESVRAAHDTKARLEALDELADLLELGLRDDEGARKAALHTLELMPTNEPAVERLERLAMRDGRRERLVEALERRADMVDDEERVAVLARLARLHEQAPPDTDAAIRAWADLRELEPAHAEATDALLRLYASTARHADSARLLDELVRSTEDHRARRGHLRTRARLLRDVIGDAHEAAECFRELRTLGEDEEALFSLIDYTRAAGLHGELSYLLATRLGATTDVTELTELGMERATLLLDHLADPREAERELLAVREVDPSFVPALARLSGLYLAEDNGFRLAEVTAEHLALATQPALRATLARRLFGLYERVVPDSERALGAARDWVAAAPTDLEALRALVERLDPEADADELVRALDAGADELMRRIARADADAIPPLRDEAIGALGDSVRTNVLYRKNLEHAEARLLRALELAHAQAHDVDAIVRMCGELDAHVGVDTLRRAAATFLARKATNVVRPIKERLYLTSADLFGSSLADGARAFEVLRRAIGECPDEAEVLQSLVEYGTAGGFEEPLDRVLEECFEAAVDVGTARALLRERCDLLYSLGRYGDAADQYQRLSSMDPTNERAKARHRECLSRAERYQDLLIALGQALRHLGYDDMPRRVALLRDVARTWDRRLENRFEGLDAWKKVLSAAPGDAEAIEAIERLTPRSRAEGAELPERRSLAPTLASSRSMAPPPVPGVRASVPPPPPPPRLSSVPPPPPED